MIEFRQAVATWFEHQFGVQLDPAREVLTLIGSKEGIAHIPFAFVNEGDYVLVPDPGYPVYKASTILAGGKVHPVPLLEERDFLPCLDDIPSEVARAAKIMFINYPNNPTGATADKQFFQQVIEFAREYDIIVCQDGAYAMMSYNGYKAPSILEIEGAKDYAIEFHSLSKTFNMTGWRIGFACGSAEILSGLGKVKTNIDSGAFQAIQIAGIEALKQGWEHHAKSLKIYAERRDLMYEGLRELGFKLCKPKATFYLWVKTPGNMTSTEFAEYLLEKAGVIVTPGVGFGEYGEGFFRIALTTTQERLKEALRRIRENI